MAAQTDFWGELGTAELRTPVTIMREQAALLGAKTQNVIEASVRTDTSIVNWFVHHFDLIVPSMDNYSYELFRVQHQIELYPVYTTVPSVGQLQLETEEQFREWLRGKLSSSETKRIIANLLSLARR